MVTTTMPSVARVVRGDIATRDRDRLPFPHDIRRPNMASRYPQRYPSPQNDESPAEAELAKPLRSLRKDGAG